jgi:hypothetical protein
MELFEFGYAAYVAFFAGAALILVYAILLAAGASLAEWIIEQRASLEPKAAGAATSSSHQSGKRRSA